MGSSKKNTTLFLRDRPLFGLDIGRSTIKLMQVDHRTINSTHGTKLIGYGTTSFDPSAMKNGVVEKPELIASAVFDLFKYHLIGDITTRRVALTIPSYRTYSRSLQLPKAPLKELRESVQLEMEQYIPVPIDQMYVDFTITSQTKDTCNIYAVAVPRGIVDSYVQLMRILGLETVLIETTMSSAIRLLSLDKADADMVNFVIDFGSESSDISIFNDSLIITGTVSGGGYTFTQLIKEKLGVTEAEAALIKTKYGLNLSKKQKDIQAALEPVLTDLVKEIQRMTRYYEKTSSQARPLSQIIALGGGANMPGLSDYLVSALRIPVRTYDPWHRLNYKNFQPPNTSDKPMYATVAGLSMCDPKEVFKS